MPEVDDDQLAALRRLRAAFGPIEVIEVVNIDRDDLAAGHAEQPEGSRGASAAGEA